MIPISDPVFAALVGAGGGILLGLAARLGRFCTLGALEDMFYGDSTGRVRMWGIAIGTAILTTFGATALGLANINATHYLTLSLNIPAAILGGLLFGYGMALAGNCGFGALARLGGGDLRSLLIVLVMGLSAYITLSGPLAYLRVSLFPQIQTTPTGIAHMLGQTLGASIPLTGMVIGSAILFLSLLSRRRIVSNKGIFWGVIAGLAITSGWVGTSYVAATGFGSIAVVSHTFSAPLGETMLFAMTSSARNMSFGIGSVTGVLLGAFLGSLIKGHFRWEACDDPRELRRQILGAALMGVGAVLANGCSIGQGLSAFSVLSLSAPLTLAAIVLGAYIGLRQLIEGFTSDI